jgi:hypothetical protein
MRYRKVTWLTDGSGNATVYGDAILGEVCAIDYLPGTTDTGATVSVYDYNGDFTHTLLVKATAGTSNTRFYPRELVHKAEDGAALTGTAGGDRTEPVAAGRLKVTIASGGDTKTGSVVVWYD